MTNYGQANHVLGCQDWTSMQKRSLFETSESSKVETKSDRSSSTMQVSCLLLYACYL